MPLITYESKNFGAASLALIARVNEIAAEYAAQGYGLTLRQLYYQLVARDIVPNTQQSYKRVGNIVNDARLAGLVDWDHLTDRTRNLQKLSTWSTPEDIIDSAAYSFRRAVWADQRYRVEVWVEKEALADVVGRAADVWDVPYFSCRGYVSQSEMWAAAQRLRRYESNGQRTIVIHLGDHDPSGIDMTRDITDRLAMFRSRARVRRIALTMAQIEQYSPPPNPAKVTDSRYAEYEQEYGDESWELDALEPSVLDALIQATIQEYVDMEAWRASKREQETQRAQLTAVSQNWQDTVGWMTDGGMVDEPDLSQWETPDADGDPDD